MGESENKNDRSVRAGKVPMQRTGKAGVLFSVSCSRAKVALARAEIGSLSENCNSQIKARRLEVY